jgi:hypothetical protein
MLPSSLCGESDFAGIVVGRALLCNGAAIDNLAPAALFAQATFTHRQ